MKDMRAALQARKRSKRAKANGRKGSSFERDVCKRLSKWMSRGLRDDLFWRTAMSGGRATLQRRAGRRNQQQVGDVCSIDALGERLTSVFVLECKNYSNLRWESFLRGNVSPGTIAAFWTQCARDATACGRLPMLICKQSQLGEFVLLDSVGQDVFNLGSPYATFHSHMGPRVFELTTFLLLARRPNL